MACPSSQGGPFGASGVLSPLPYGDWIGPTLFFPDSAAFYIFLRSFFSFVGKFDRGASSFEFPMFNVFFQRG